MSDDFLGARKKSLEETFFAKQNAALLERMRAEREKAERIQALRSASQIRDLQVLGRLVDLGLDAPSWAALCIVPLVEVAWADGEIAPRERDAILAAAEQQGVAPGSPGRKLLETWLVTRPDAALFASWGAYATELASQLGAPEREALKHDIVERSRKVAEAAGGILGLGSTSDAEKRVLAALEKPFA
jgi:hypothetical protein